MYSFWRVGISLGIIMSKFKKIRKCFNALINDLYKI